MLFYKIKIYVNGVKSLNLASDQNESLDLVIDRVIDSMASASKTGSCLLQDKFYHFNIYDENGSIIYGKGILSPNLRNLDLEFTHKTFERCFVCGKKYVIILSEVYEPMMTISINDKMTPMYISGKNKFVDWIYTYRFHIESLQINTKSFPKFDLDEINESLDQKVNAVYIKTK